MGTQMYRMGPTMYPKMPRFYVPFYQAIALSSKTNQKVATMEKTYCNKVKLGNKPGGMSQHSTYHVSS